MPILPVFAEAKPEKPSQRQAKQPEPDVYYAVSEEKKQAEAFGDDGRPVSPFDAKDPSSPHADPLFTDFASAWWAAENESQSRVTKGGISGVSGVGSPRAEAAWEKAPNPGTQLAFLPVDRLSVKDVSGVLSQLRLPKYISSFKEARIDGAALVALTEEEMEDLGVNLKAHRRRLFMEIDKYREQGVPLVAQVNVAGVFGTPM